ncbi:MAG: hypothetical protein ACP5QS_02965, partial [bacterium]
MGIYLIRLTKQKIMFISSAVLFSLTVAGAFPFITGDTYTLSFSRNGSIISLKNRKTQTEIL